MFGVLVHHRARKAFARLEERARRQIAHAIDRLKADPFGVRNLAPLQGEYEGLHRLRVGEYRVVIQIVERERLILILGVSGRGHAYK